MRILVALIGLVVAWYVVGRATSPMRRITLYAPDPTVPTTKPGDGQLKILAYNIAHGRGLADTNFAGDRTQRLTQIAELLRTQDADVVVLNEVDLDSTWSGRINQGRFIAEHAGYPFRAEQTNYDLSLPLFRIRFGNVILSRVPVSSAEFVRYASPSRLESIAYGQKDGLLCTLDLGSGRKVRVLGVHLESRFEPTRVATLPILQSLLKQIDVPLILAGDFNSVRSEEASPRTAVDRLLHDTNLTRINGNFGGSFPSPSPEIQIDHVFAQPPWNVEEFGVINTQLSDHRPVWAKLRIEAQVPTTAGYR